MVSFKNVEITDKQWIDELLLGSDGLSTMECFGSYFLWSPAFKVRIARVEDRLLLHYPHFGTSFFGFPAGKGSVRPAIEAMQHVADELQQPMVIGGMTEQQKALLEAELPGVFEFRESPDQMDYIYEVEKMVSLSGKKLHSKKNHCNRFEKEYPDWHFEPLRAEHEELCMKLLGEWQEGHDGGHMQEAENMAIRLAFDNYEALGMLGGALLVGDELVAFTMAEKIGRICVDIHFEKANTAYLGSYAMINREFARYLTTELPELVYVNREEDMGLENLKKAKESYQPAMLLMKYDAL